MAKFQKWEYLVEVSREVNGNHEIVETEHLNERGEEGWELVSLIRLDMEFEHRVFKRPKASK